MGPLETGFSLRGSYHKLTKLIKSFYYTKNQSSTINAGKTAFIYMRMEMNYVLTVDSHVNVFPLTVNSHSHFFWLVTVDRI